MDTSNAEFESIIEHTLESDGLKGLELVLANLEEEKQ